MSTSTALDITALGRALEERDTDAAIAHYADDAEVRIVDASTPPSSPLVLSGREAIRAWFADVNARDMTHRVSWSVEHDDKASLAVDCLYPDGTKVLCAAMYDTANGRIVRELRIQTWDS